MCLSFAYLTRPLKYVYLIEVVQDKIEAKRMISYEEVINIIGLTTLNTKSSSKFF